MLIFKKLIFSIPFLIAFMAFCLQLKHFLTEPMLILGLDSAALQLMILTSVYVILASLFFVLLTTLAQEWRLVFIIAPAIFVTSILFLPYPLSFLIVIFYFLALSLVYFTLKRKLDTYLNFQPLTLLMPSIAQAVTLLLLVSSIAFFIETDGIIKKQGFKVPDSLINTVLQLMPAQSLPNQNINQSSPQTFIKATIETQLQNIISPYLSFVPLILTVIFFITLKGTTSLLSIFLHPIIWLTFWMLAKTKFINYTTETREVKKMVLA